MDVTEQSDIFHACLGDLQVFDFMVVADEVTFERVFQRPDGGPFLVPQVQIGVNDHIFPFKLAGGFVRGASLRHPGQLSRCGDDIFKSVGLHGRFGGAVPSGLFVAESHETQQNHQNVKFFHTFFI